MKHHNREVQAWESHRNILRCHLQAICRSNPVHSYLDDPRPSGPFAERRLYRQHPADIRVTHVIRPVTTFI